MNNRCGHQMRLCTGRKQRGFFPREIPSSSSSSSSTGIIFIIFHRRHLLFCHQDVHHLHQFHRLHHQSLRHYQYVLHHPQLFFHDNNQQHQQHDHNTLHDIILILYFNLIVILIDGFSFFYLFCRSHNNFL